MPFRASVKPAHVLTAIVLLGAVLRFFPIWFGLPYLGARPDEGEAIGHAAAMLAGDLNPHFFHWPSLTLYTFAALFTVASGLRRALFVAPELTHPEQIILARTFVAIAGSVTIVVLFTLARRMVDTTTGLLAAVFLAVAILHVRESHFAMTDVVMTLLVMLSLLLLVRAVQAEPGAKPHREGADRLFAAAGVAGGLAASTKYSGAAIIAAVAAAQVLVFMDGRKGLAAWKPSADFLAAFGCAFLIATPYALLDFPAFLTDFRFDMTHLAAGHVGNLARGWSYHFTRSLPYGLGLPICIAAIAGLVPTAKHHARPAFVVGAFAAASYAAVGSGYTVFFRYILPLVPIVCLLAAVGVRYVATWLADRTGLSQVPALVLLMALVGGSALMNSVWFDVMLARTDTRVLAAEWLIPRLKADETLHEAGSVYAALDLSSAPFHRWSFDPAAHTFGDPEGHTPDWLVFEESPLWTYGSVPSELQQLARDKYALAWMVRATAGPPADQAGVYDLQDAFFLPLNGFSAVERPGPTIRIYRRRD